MKKLLKPKDLLMFLLAGAGDAMEEATDPLHLVSSAYKNMYGFVPNRYKKHNFIQTVGRSLKTGDIEKIVKGDKVYLKLTSVGNEKIQRYFSINSLTKTWNKKWVVILFDISEKSRAIRNRLRNKLQNLGFGMLQKSVWITPLSIGKDMLEFIEVNNLSNSAFVLEVSHMLFGDPKELAKKVWHLDVLESEYLKLKKGLEKMSQLIGGYDDRHNKREAKANKIQNKTQSKIQRLLKRRYLEFCLSLPPLPKELLPKTLQDLKPFKFQ